MSRLFRLFTNLAGALAGIAPGQLVEHRLLLRRELIQARRAALLGRELLPETRLNFFLPRLPRTAFLIRGAPPQRELWRCFASGVPANSPVYL